MNYAETWTGCYSGTFDLLTPESFAHPAKMSAALCYRIIEHLERLGLLKAGATILDPMGGTGLTAICANAKGYKAVTVELEERFIGFQQANKDYAARKIGRPLDWTMIRGDSRKLSDLLAQRGLITVTSPPYGDISTSGQTSKNTVEKRQLRGVAGAVKLENGKYMTANGKYLEQYNPENPSNIGNLPDRPITVTSPPYGDIAAQFRNTGSKLGGEKFQYGANSETNIGNLADEADYTDDTKAAWWRRKAAAGQSESYLSAMRLVYAEIAKISDVCVTVTKNPTRAGKLRRLDEDTKSLLESVGFRILCHHKALLFTETETVDLFGQTHKKVKGRMSFFKRLSYQKGNAVAQWEDILVAVKNGARNIVTVTSPPYQEAGDARVHGGLRVPVPHGNVTNVLGDTPGQIGKLR